MPASNCRTCDDKTYLFVGRDNEREVITDKPGALSRQDRLLTESADDRSFFAGIGRNVNEMVDFRLGVRGGLKPYAQARYQRPVAIRRQAIWSNSARRCSGPCSDHIGSTTALSYDHTFSRSLIARWLSAATITQRNSKFEWSTSLGAYKGFGEQRLLSLEALMSGVQGSGVAVSDYGLQTKWEQPIYRDWMLGELLVGHFWPRRDAASERSRAWAIGTRLKMRF